MDQDYQEIDLIELIKKILKFWWLLGLAAILCGGIAYYVTKNHITPIYSAQSTVFIGKEQNSLAGITYADVMMGNQLLSDYRELIRSNRVLEETIIRLKLDTTPGILRGKVSINLVADSRFIYVNVKDPSPEMAMAIANSVTEVLVEKAYEVIGVNNVSIVDAAQLPKVPVSPSTLRNTAIAAVLGIMMGLFIIFINMMLNNTIEKDEDIEKIVGLPVIGIIPKFKGDPR